MIGDRVDRFERVGCLGYHVDPMLRLRPARVDRDDLAARGILVGLEPEDGPVVVDERVLGLELTDQVDRFGVRLFERTVEDAIFVVRPFLDDEDQVVAVVGDQRIGTPLFVLGIFPYKTVVGLRAAEAVIKDLLIIIRALQVIARPGLGKTAVEKALAIGRPFVRRKT